MNQADEDALVLKTAVAMGVTSGGTNFVCRSMDEIRLAIRAAVAAERERCAKACIDQKVDSPYADLDDFNIGCDMCAAAIRRGP